MSRLWTPADPFAQRARMHSGRARLVAAPVIGESQGPAPAGVIPGCGPSAVWDILRTVRETDRSVSRSRERHRDGHRVAAPRPLIAGRRRETVPRGGCQSDARAVELLTRLRARPATHDACVTGVPRITPGEPVGACVVSVDPAVVGGVERTSSSPDATAAADPRSPRPSSPPSRPPGDGR